MCNPSPRVAPRLFGHRLRSAVRDALWQEYARFLLNPLRTQTDEQWAEAHGVNDKTLWRWRQHPEFRGLMAQWREPAKVVIPDILKALIKRVKRTGDPIAARLLLEVIGEFKPALELTGKMTLAEFFSRWASTHAAEVERESVSTQDTGKQPVN